MIASDAVDEGQCLDGTSWQVTEKRAPIIASGARRDPVCLQGTMEGAVKITAAFVTGISILGTAGTLFGPSQALAACVGLHAACPPPPRGCIFNRVDNLQKACKLPFKRPEHVKNPAGKIIGVRWVDACYPAAQCRYTTPPGAERRCGTTLLYAQCAAP